MIMENSCNFITAILGKSILFNTSKWESFETMKEAFEAKAQSTNLLSSWSSSMAIVLNQGSINST